MYLTKLSTRWRKQSVKAGKNNFIVERLSATREGNVTSSPYHSPRIYTAAPARGTACVRTAYAPTARESVLSRTGFHCFTRRAGNTAVPQFYNAPPVAAGVHNATLRSVALRLPCRLPAGMPAACAVRLPAHCLPWRALPHAASSRRHSANAPARLPAHAYFFAPFLAAPLPASRRALQFTLLPTPLCWLAAADGAPCMSALWRRRKRWQRLYTIYWRRHRRAGVRLATSATNTIAARIYCSVAGGTELGLVAALRCARAHAAATPISMPTVSPVRQY